MKGWKAYERFISYSYFLLGRFGAPLVHSLKILGVSVAKSYRLTSSEISHILSSIFLESTNRQRDFHQGWRIGFRTASHASFSDDASLNIV